jgi:hypothetical protein
MYQRVGTCVIYKPTSSRNMVAGNHEQDYLKKKKRRSLRRQKVASQDADSGVSNLTVRCSKAKEGRHSGQGFILFQNSLIIA